jgi:hypothetical protein
MPLELDDFRKPHTGACCCEVREEEAALRVKEAEGALAEAQRKLRLAEERSTAAEAAKIELSVKLASALSEQESTDDVSAMPTRCAPQPPPPPATCTHRVIFKSKTLLS